MARLWTRSPSAGDIAWHLDADESAVVAAALAVATFGTSYNPGWIEGVRQHGILSGKAVTNSALVGLNEILERHGLPPMRFLDEGEGRSYSPYSEQAEDRIELLASMEGMPQSALFRRYAVLLDACRHSGAAAAAPKPLPPIDTSLRPATNLRRAWSPQDEEDVPLPPSILKILGGTEGSVLERTEAARPKSTLSMPVPLPAAAERTASMAGVEIEAMTGPEAALEDAGLDAALSEWVEFEDLRRPTLDGATLAHLIRCAPNSETAAWLAAYLPRT